MKEENIKGEYQRKVDKSLIPTCNIMGVNIAAINMNWLLKYLDENLSDIKGDYICVSNVHIGLDEKTSKWCEVIERYNGYKRKNTRMEITKAGFDIDDTVIRLERIYLSKKRVL